MELFFPILKITYGMKIRLPILLTVVDPKLHGIIVGLIKKLLFVGMSSNVL